MVRRMTPAQARSAMRQAQQKARQAEQKQREAIRRYNAEVDRVNAHNKRVVDDYNRKARAHNARVRAHQQRLRTEISRLQQRQTTTRYVVTQRSTLTLHRAFTTAEAISAREEWGPDAVALLEAAEGEAANSAGATNSLLEETSTGHGGDVSPLQDTRITVELTQLSGDLDQRWRGALFSLHPSNPDAARHFCTSCREVLTGMIDMAAPDSEVMLASPQCDTTKDGRPQRRVKINYLLARRGIDHDSLGDFVDRDVDDVLGLFREFNSATHGAAGKYDLPRLTALKVRVEGAIQFLSLVTRPA